MASILIFSDIVDEVMSNPDERFVLFGKPAQVRTPKNVHDLYYTFMANTQFEKYAKESDLVIPVLPQSSSNLTPEFYQLHSQFPKFTTFGAREADSATGRLTLNFYDITTAALGTVISPVPEYTLTSQEECVRLLPDWENLNAFLRKERERITSKYL